MKLKEKTHLINPCQGEQQHQIHQQQKQDALLWQQQCNMMLSAQVTT
jgi:hypothetical protein